MLPAGAKIELGKLATPAKKPNYITYEGSLTTPPCSEGLLWHVIMQPQTISWRQLVQYRWGSTGGAPACAGPRVCARAQGTVLVSRCA